MHIIYHPLKVVMYAFLFIHAKYISLVTSRSYSINDIEATYHTERNGTPPTTKSNKHNLDVTY